MRHRVKVVGITSEVRAAHDGRVYFRALMGAERFRQRQRDIAALPRVDWRGHPLHTLRCQGDFGKGPHDMNVPLSLLWHLIDLGRYLCAFHR